MQTPKKIHLIFSISESFSISTIPFKTLPVEAVSNALQSTLLGCCGTFGRIIHFRTASQITDSINLTEMDQYESEL